MVNLYLLLIALPCGFGVPMLYYLESYTSWRSSSYGNNGCEGNCCHTIEHLTVVVSVKYCDLSPYIIRAPLYNCSQSWIAFLLWYACALMKHFFVELQGRENTLCFKEEASDFHTGSFFFKHSGLPCCMKFSRVSFSCSTTNGFKAS